MLLTRQFRMPAFLNEHPDGMLVETAAGLLDDDEYAVVEPHYGLDGPPNFDE